MKKKTNFKTTAFIGLFIIVMCFCLIPISANASTKLKSNNGIKYISKNVSLYLYTRWASDWDSNCTKTLYMDAYNRALMISITYIEYNQIYHHNYQSIKDDGGDRIYIPLSQANKYSKKLFGKNMEECYGGDDFSFSDDRLYIKPGELGDLTTEYPSYKIKRIDNLGHGKYKIKMSYYDNFDENCDGECIVRKKVGTAFITIKKSNKSPYGYVITKIHFNTRLGGTNDY